VKHALADGETTALFHRARSCVLDVATERARSESCSCVNGRFVRQVDSMLRELNVRFRDIRQGPDECLYVLTEGRSRGNQDTDGMLLRIEPVPTTE